MSKTVVGLFSTAAQAQQAKQALVSQGIDSSDIHIVGKSGAGAGTGTETGAAGIGEKIGNYFRQLTGGDEEAHQGYSSGVQTGGAVVSATVPDEQAQQVATLLHQQGARELQGGSQSYAGQTSGSAYGTGAAATTGALAGATTGNYGNTTTGNLANTTGEVIPIVEEQLVVGKREVNQGGVRVYSHVVERPADAEILLREEHINVERTPVNRAATEADFLAASGPAIELNATAEEAVVGKAARVVEEVRVGKTSTEHAETIHDSVRKTEVEVEQIPGTATTTATSGLAGTTTGGFAGTTTQKQDY